MPKFSIHHITQYSYESPVRDSANQVILYPIEDEFQQLIRQQVLISGDPSVDTHIDYYGNKVGSFTRAEPHTELIIDSKIEVETRSRPRPLDVKSIHEQWENLHNSSRQWPFIDFLKQENFAAVKDVFAIARQEKIKEITPLQTTQNLTSYVFNNFQYIKGITTVESTLDEVWELKAGVCQDFAHILLVMLKMINIPARYVSGYICPNQNGMRGESATHAWVEAYIPFYGWLGFDPTNNCLAEDMHVRLAVGRSFTDCSPVKGTYKGNSKHELKVGVSVSYENGSRVEEIPTILVTTPSKNGTTENSYRRYQEMMMQQQQQQQQ